VLVGGPPPEFDGDPGHWSPEHLLLSSANLCLMTTYMALAKKAGLDISAYRSTAEGVLEKTKEGILFTRIALEVSILAPASRLDEARKLMDTAKKYCIVSNALRRPVEVQATVAAGEFAGAPVDAALPGERTSSRNPVP
jgi:organic hydroperoxide reductase OsmC/OhrA